MKVPEDLAAEKLLRSSGQSSSGLGQASSETAIKAGVAVVRRRRIVILASHVIQYSSPLFRRMAQDPRLDLQIAYCTLQGATPSIDPEFGVKVILYWVDIRGCTCRIARPFRGWGAFLVCSIPACGD